MNAIPQTPSSSTPLPGKNVLDFAIEHGLSPQKISGTHGGEYASPCPLCGGRDRFRIWPEQNDGKGSFWCRQCGIHGDRIQFVMETRKISFREAAELTGDSDKLQTGPHRKGFLASIVPETVRVRIAGARVPSCAHRSEPTPQATPPIDRERWWAKAEALVTWGMEHLPGSEGLAFLEKRGLGLVASQKYCLGYLSEDLYRPREAWGLDSIFLPAASSATHASCREEGPKEKPQALRPKRLWIPKGLLIPHRCAVTGKIDRIRIRRPEGEPRYYVLPGSASSTMVFGSAPVISVVVVESELDAILIDDLAGDLTATIALGSSQAKPDSHAQRLLESAACILVALDNDEAGARAAAWWLRHYKRAIRWPVPVGKDPSEAYQSGIDLREWILAGWPIGMRIGASERPPRPSVPQAIPPSSDTPSPETAPEASAPGDALSEIYDILRKHPGIRIQVSESRLTLDAPPQWMSRHPSLFQRLSRLIFFDPEVFHWLHYHPCTSIDRSNFYDFQGGTSP